MTSAGADYFRLIKTEIWSFEGPDAQRFLSGISTPHLSRSAAPAEQICGRGLFLDPKGKLLAPFIFLKESESKICLRLDIGADVDAETRRECHQTIFDQLGGLIIADRVQIQRAPLWVTLVWSDKLRALSPAEPLPAIKAQAQDQVFVAGNYHGAPTVPTPHRGANAFELWSQGETPVAVGGSEINARQLAKLCFDTRFLEFPTALHPGDLPLEFGFADAISFFKGCYRGQEVIARVTYRGKLVKGLCEWQMDASGARAGETLENAEGQNVGEIRVVSEDGRRALGLLRFDADLGVRTAQTKIAISQVHRLVEETNELFR